MRKTLEDLYYGNIIPCERQMTPDSELKRAVDRVSRYESQLAEQLDETGQTLLTKLVRSQHEIGSITARENFILGFRLGVRIMAECMDEDDGDIRNGGDLPWRSVGRPGTAWCAGGTMAAGRAAS